MIPPTQMREKGWDQGYVIGIAAARGRRCSIEIADPRGDATNPMDDDEVAAKLKTDYGDVFVAPRFPRVAAQAWDHASVWLSRYLPRRRHGGS